ncbi:hypothetical protein [Streptomyces sp. NPDC050804]|uniref:hypothetical protein n=1 Tax=Streptomyces sp. NPDC050804 TaxID=3154745 RepID=UPI00342DD5E1
MQSEVRSGVLGVPAAVGEGAGGAGGLVVCAAVEEVAVVAGQPFGEARVKAEVISAGVLWLKLADQTGMPSGSRYWVIFQPP